VTATWSSSTSSVDSRTEALIYEALFKAFRDKAIVSSIHRLHLLAHFDYVYVLHQGRIVAEGTFEHLRDNNPAFREMLRHAVSKPNTGVS
jgi:ABC-type multidrug transport system fused ATPase/permease subunit